MFRPVAAIFRLLKFCPKCIIYMPILRGDAEISSSLRVTIRLFSGKSNGQWPQSCHIEIACTTIFRLNSGYACYQNILSYCLPSNNINHKLFRSLILPVVSMGVKLGRSYWGRNTDWGCSRMGCWERYMGLIGTRLGGSGENCLINFIVCMLKRNKPTRCN